MSWGADFLASLELPVVAPVFLLSRKEIDAEPGAAYSIGSMGNGSDPLASIGDRGAQVQGQTLSPRGPWTATVGAWSVDIVGDVYNLRRALTKGTIVELQVGLGYASHMYVFEPIALGQVTNLRYSGGRYTLECRDFFSALKTRLSVSYASAQLFYQLHSTTLSADAAVGAGTYNTVSSASWGKETGGYGAILVTPAGGGTPYYRLYSATTGTTITIQAPGTASVMSTTDVGAAAGDVIAEVAYLQGHPIDVARKVLATKDGSNGVYDVLPAHCGLRVPDSLLDHDDMDVWKSSVVVVSSGSYTWQLPVAEVAPDAVAWFASILSPSGLFLAMRQGKITVRAAQLVTAGAYPDTFELTDDDIAEVLEWECYEPGFGVEAELLTVVCSSTTATADGDPAVTLPAVETVTQTVTPMVHLNGPAVCTEVAERCVEAATKIAGRLTVRTANLRAAQLTVGDVILLRTRHVGDGDGPNPWDGLNRRVLVDETDPDWMAGSCVVGMLIYALNTETFPPS